MKSTRVEDDPRRSGDQVSQKDCFFIGVGVAAGRGGGSRVGCAFGEGGSGKSPEGALRLSISITTG